MSLKYQRFYKTFRRKVRFIHKHMNIWRTLYQNSGFCQLNFSGCTIIVARMIKNWQVWKLRPNVLCGFPLAPILWQLNIKPCHFRHKHHLSVCFTPCSFLHRDVQLYFNPKCMCHFKLLVKHLWHTFFRHINVRQCTIISIFFHSSHCLTRLVDCILTNDLRNSIS